jgi:hypothetical protein
MALRKKSAAKSPTHFVVFLKNLFDVNELVEIHESLTGTEPGRRRGVEILNKSAVVLLLACWEAYVEDLAEAGSRHLIQRVRVASDVPRKVRVIASQPLSTSPNPLDVWKLAGGGWKDVLRAKSADTISSHVRGSAFNNPSAEKCDELFHALLGLRGLSSHWRWPGRTAVSSRTYLGTLISRRGEVAHRLTTDSPVKKKEVTKASEFIARLSEVSSDVVRTHLEQVTGHAPWPKAFPSSFSAS